jgi:SprT-like family
MEVYSIRIYVSVCLSLFLDVWLTDGRTDGQTTTIYELWIIFCFFQRRIQHLANCAEERLSRIELSTKVLDSADRLRDTLVHEMCHAASWIVSGYVFFFFRLKTQRPGVNFTNILRAAFLRKFFTQLLYAYNLSL